MDFTERNGRAGAQMEHPVPPPYLQGILTEHRGHPIKTRSCNWLPTCMLPYLRAVLLYNLTPEPEVPGTAF